MVDCSICLEELVPSQLIYLNCLHCMCDTCFGRLVSQTQISRVCPLCRYDFLQDIGNGVKTEVFRVPHGNYQDTVNHRGRATPREDVFVYVGSNLVTWSVSEALENEENAVSASHSSQSSRRTQTGQPSKIERRKKARERKIYNKRIRREDTGLVTET